MRRLHNGGNYVNNWSGPNRHSGSDSDRGVPDVEPLRELGVWPKWDSRSAPSGLIDPPINGKSMNKELTLREYEANDIPRLIEMFMGALPRIPNYAMIVPDPSRIRNVLVNNVQNADHYTGWVLCDSHNIPQGCAAGWCVRSLMSQDLVADDIIMWIEPEYRTLRSANMLLDTYVQWAKARGAKLIRASHTGGSWPKGSKEYILFDALLRRQGFSEVGSIYHWQEGE